MHSSQPFGLTRYEYRTLKRLSTPPKIQDFLDTLPINFEERGDTCLRQDGFSTKKKRIASKELYSPRTPAPPCRPDRNIGRQTARAEKTLISKRNAIMPCKTCKNKPQRHLMQTQLNTYTQKREGIKSI